MFIHMPKYCVEFSLRTQTLLKFYVYVADRQMHTEISSDPSTAQLIMAGLGGKVLESEAWNLLSPLWPTAGSTPACPSRTSFARWP